jgi:hypothetical protein
LHRVKYPHAPGIARTLRRAHGDVVDIRAIGSNQRVPLFDAAEFPFEQSGRHLYRVERTAGQRQALDLKGLTALVVDITVAVIGRRNARRSRIAKGAEIAAFKRVVEPGADPRKIVVARIYRGGIVIPALGVEPRAVGNDYPSRAR